MSTDEPRSSRPTHRPVLVLSALIALAVILIATFWALLQEPAPLGMVRLADGSVMRLEAVTVGPQQRFVSGPRWRRLLARWLPPGPPNRLVGTVHSYPYAGQGPSEMVVWTLFRPPPSQRADSLWAVLFDEHGCRFPTNQYWEPPDGNDQVTARVAQAAPRRGAWIGVRLERWGFGGAGAPLNEWRAPAAEFRAPNPAHGPYPIWKPEPLPITRRDGPLSITLAALTTGAAGPWSPLRPAAAGQATWSRASFKITLAGRRADEWYQPMLLTLSDATGNHFYPQGGGRYRLGGMTHVAFEGGLCVEEPAWKVKVEIAQMSHFAAADLWTVRGVPVTRQGRITHSFAWTTRHGIRIKLVGIPKTAAQAPVGVIGIGVNVYPAALLQTSVPLSGMQLSLVRATDDRGREVGPTHSGPYGAREYGFSLKPFADTRRVDLTFAIARSRFAEFVAKPARLRRSAE